MDKQEFDSLFSLAGRHIVVAGGASGIGQGVALSLAHSGALIEVWDNDPIRLEETETDLSSITNTYAIQRVDVTDLANVERAAADAEARAPVDSLFNSVGISSARQTALEITQEAWQRMLDVNLTGAWNLSRALGRAMVERGQGSIVHVASTNTIDPSPGIAHYCVSKAGLGMLVQALGLEWAGAGVRVNGIGPGPIVTPMTEAIFRKNPTLRDEWLARVPMKTLGTPASLVGAAVFLLTDASSWMTGQIIYVDGGWLL
jgi:NAD(P)-dependent dehydrogenase (short-subunit alcohol dehydrogenase family)